MTALTRAPWQYLIVFGSAIGTEGHTGRHTRRLFPYSDGSAERRTRRASHPRHLQPRRCQLYAFAALRGRTAWPPRPGRSSTRRVSLSRRAIPAEAAADTPRSWIPLMLPFGFADTFFSTSTSRRCTTPSASQARDDPQSPQGQDLDNSHHQQHKIGISPMHSFEAGRPRVWCR